MADRFKGRVSHEIKALGTSIIVKGTVEIAIKYSARFNILYLI